MRILHWTSLSAAERCSAMQRPAQLHADEIAAAAKDSIDRVRLRGDRALLDLTERFDGVQLREVAVPEAEFAAAEAALSEAQHTAIATAIATVRSFHAAQAARPLRVETAPGVVCERITAAVRAVGLYVPAGSAPLPSTAIMLCVPAAIAGCPVRILCTPPQPSGSADPAVLVAARKAGATQVFKVGGAQAIAAMAYGTESVPKCDKIFGPGNAWVTAAKLLVAGDAAGAAADLPAGVSEVMVIADDSARADFVAADLLAQAEHSREAQAILVTDSSSLAEEVAEQVPRQMRSLSRTLILRDSVANMRLIVVPSMAEAFVVANDYAPEHLLLQIRDARSWLDRVNAAGAIFLGSWSCESIGDYCSGPNHTLPTYGYARAYSGLGLEDFQKRITVQELSAAGLENLGPTAQVLAELEGLDAHAASVSIRLQALASEGEGAVAAKPADSVAPSALLTLARPEILTLKPYAHAAWLPSLTRLHANEAPWRPEGDLTAAGLNRYPEPQPKALVARLAELYGVSVDMVLVGRGSDEAIDLLSRIYLRSGQDSILQCTPTFGMYQVAARIQGASVVEMPLDRARGWAMDVEGLLRLWNPSIKLVYLCSPNNPTSNSLDPDSIRRICQALSGKAIVVVDEAYIEWSTMPSLTSWLPHFPTMALLRTLSKAHALAGARVGALIAQPALIQLANRVIPPYCLAQSTIEATLRALEPDALAASGQRRSALLKERGYLAEGLNNSPLVAKVWPSDTNFLLIDCHDATGFLQASTAGGTIVRDLRANPVLSQSLRVSVGTRLQNDALLASVAAR